MNIGDIGLNYLDANKQLWDERAKVHFDSDFYDVPAFLNGKNSLKQIELELLGEIKGKSVLHLQCHFGMDTLSLARMGAEVMGVDFSEEAMAKAKKLSEMSGLNGKFVCTDIYSLKDKLDGHFDIIFTSYGTIGWLPDMKAWAGIVSHFLKPGGRFIFADFHPVVWMFDEEFSHVQYSYFNKETILEENEGTYADRSADIKRTSYGWNHDISEVLSALLDSGLRLESFREHDYSPYDCFRNTVEIEPGRFAIKGMEGKIPMVYAFAMNKPV